MKNNLLGAGAALLAATIPAAALAQRAPAAAVVVIEVDRVTNQCNACRTAQASLNTQLQQLRSRQQQLSAPLQTEAQAIETAARALNGRQPDAALQARITAFQQRQNTANQELARGEQNIRSIQAHVIQQISQRLNPIINQVMTARGANLAVNVDATLAHAGALNVTNDVLAQLNQQLPSLSLTPLPQQAQPAAQQPQQQNRPRGR